MAFILTLVVFIIYHELLTGLNSVELTREHLTDGQRFTFQEGNVNNEQRRVNFQSSLKRQAFLNSVLKKSNSSARYGVNQFSFLSQQQFKERYLTTRAEKVPKFDPSRSRIQGKTTIPPKFDWRDHGIVGLVRNQGACGGCWAFTVVETIESVYAKDGGKLQQLSVQQLIDCSYESAGCKGGYPVKTLEWLAQTKLKLVKEVEYPYKGVDGICQYFPLAHEGVAVKNCSAFDFSEAAEDEMIDFLLESGPLVATVDAVSWQDYMGGIIQHHCSSHNANHAVVITGYDTTGEVPYWIIRNSWGTSWGDNGYVYIKMGDDMCGIADCVADVLV